MRRIGIALPLLMPFVLVACGGNGKPPVVEQMLNVYTWADYIAPDTVGNFQRETGITVQYSTFESNEVLVTRLWTRFRTGQ